MKTLSILLFLSTQLLLVVSGEHCHPADKKALLNIQLALHNPKHLASWKPNTDCCQWTSVQCLPPTYRVNSLIIDTADVSAQIPAAVGDLPYLNTLTFRKLSNLTGPIHPAIAKLKLLRLIMFNWNHLTGPVPTFLSQLKNLEALDLSNNHLTGSIPPSLSLLPKLNSLFLDHNKLTGPIPESFRMNGKTPYLFLSSNQLSGKIPTSFATSTFLLYLWRTTSWKGRVLLVRQQKGYGRDSPCMEQFGV